MRTLDRRRFVSSMLASTAALFTPTPSEAIGGVQLRFAKPAIVDAGAVLQTGRYTASLGYLPRLSGEGTPDRDFLIGRTSVNPLSVFFAGQLSNFSNTPINPRSFPQRTGTTTTASSSTLTLIVNTAVYTGSFVKGSLLKIRSASEYAKTPSTPGLIHGFVNTWDPTTGTLSLSGVYQESNNTGPFTDWQLVGHSPYLAARSTDISAVNAGNLTLFARSTTQIVTDWDFSAIVASPLAFSNGSATGENALIVVTQSIFDAYTNLTTTTLIGASNDQPYRLTYCDIPHSVFANAFEAHAVGTYQPYSDPGTIAPGKALTFDALPADIATNFANYKLYNKSNPRSIRYNDLQQIQSVSGNTVTLATQYVHDKANNAANIPGGINAIQDIVSDGDTILFYKMSTGNHIGFTGQIFTGACAGVLYCRIECPVDLFYYLNYKGSDQSLIYGNLITMTGHGSYHADVFQHYSLPKSSGYRMSNNIILVRPRPGLSFNSNPRDFTQTPQWGAIQSALEITNNIIELQGIGTYPFYFDAPPPLTATAIAPDYATGRVRIFYSGLGQHPPMYVNDPFFVGGFDDAMGVNSTRARAADVYADGGDLPGVAYTTPKVTVAGVVGDTTLTVSSTTGFCKGLPLTLAGTASTVTDILDGTTLQISPALKGAVNSGTIFTLNPSITVAGSNAAAAGLASYTPLGTITATINGTATSGGNFVPIADTSALRVGMKCSYSPVNSQKYFISAIVTGGINLSRKLTSSPTGTLTFNAMVRPSKTAITSVNNNYFTKQTTVESTAFVAGAATQDGYAPCIITTIVRIR